MRIKAKTDQTSAFLKGGFATLKKWFHLLLVASIVAVFVFSACNKKSPTQSNPPQPTWVTYDTSNSGLAHNSVLAIAIDASGNKWFGTAGGVSKFDNTNWTTYNTSNSGLAYDLVWTIALDASGNKWFGTIGGGVSKFDGTNWTTYNTSNSGLASNGVYAITIDALRNKWFGTRDGGVSKFHE